MLSGSFSPEIEMPLGPRGSLSDTSPGASHYRERSTPAWLTTTTKYRQGRIQRSRDERWSRNIVLLGIFIGMLAILASCTVVYLHSNRAKYVLILHDDFSVFHSDNWMHEVEIGGFSEGSLDWTTESPEQSWVNNGMLHIRPTIVDPFPLGAQVDLTETAGCSSTLRTDCLAVQNLTQNAAIPNIKTARLHSQKSITFGKAEIVAKMPRGDWIFSTVSLEPVDLIYGQFPASGGITLAQCRGNGPSYISGGRDRVDAIVHYGADGQPFSDMASKSRHQVKSYHADYSSAFHTYGVEWTPDHITIWIDRPSNTVLTVDWPNGFWRKANYASRVGNDKFLQLANPWSDGSRAAPYDVPFHLTLRTNVGAINGIFADQDDKPWYDDSGRAASIVAFQNNQSWLETWGSEEEHTMYIKDVKIWQQVI